MFGAIKHCLASLINNNKYLIDWVLIMENILHECQAYNLGVN